MNPAKKIEQKKTFLTYTLKNKQHKIWQSQRKNTFYYQKLFGYE